MHCFRNRSSFVLCLPSLPASSGKLRPLAAASDLGDQWASNRLSNLLVDGRRYKSLAGRVHIQQSTAEESCPNTTQLQPPPSSSSSSSYSYADHPLHFVSNSVISVCSPLHSATHSVDRHPTPLTCPFLWKELPGQYWFAWEWIASIYPFDGMIKELAVRSVDGWRVKRSETHSESVEL